MIRQKEKSKQNRQIEYIEHLKYKAKRKIYLENR